MVVNNYLRYCMWYIIIVYLVLYDNDIKGIKGYWNFFVFFVFYK